MSHLALMGLQVFLLSGTGSLEGDIQRSEWQSSLVIYFPVCLQGAWQRKSGFLPLSDSVVSCTVSAPWEPTTFDIHIGECQGSYWLGERDSACLNYRELARSFSMKSFNLIAEFWYLKPDRDASNLEICVAWSKHFWQAICIFCELKIESQSPLV